MAVLEVGCGTGVFLRLAADRGARVTGLDASSALVELARARAPEAEVTVGDMQFLPYADDCFDVVAGFNSFFFAADMVAALQEARRVTRPGGAVVIQVWGRPERCDLTPMKHAVRALVPPSEPEPPQRPLWQPGVLEEIARAAGLAPETSYDLSWAYAFDDDATLVSAMLAPGMVVEVVQEVGEEAARTAVLEALAPFRTASGSYRLENEWHTLIARA